ncbi:MAG: hypothetical protein AAF688_06930 [Bacteroidota bacterium]
MTRFVLSIKLSILLFCLNAISVCNAQNQYEFEGTYTIGNYKGVANFEYTLREGDTILNGKFQFSNALENVKGINTAPLIVEGQFIDNKPTGKWSFQYGEFSSSEEKKLVNYQYVVEINGVRKSMDFFLDQGRPNGQWIINIDSLKNSVVTKTLFKSEFSYDNGIPQKSFRIENDQEFMVGRLLRNAVAHDVWSLYEKDDIGEKESWNFNEGKLEKILIEDNEQLMQLPINYNNPERTISINLDKHYLDIIELQVQQQDTGRIFQHGISKLLKTDDENYELVLDFFENLKTPLDVQGFKVNVPVFPLNNQETKHIELISESHDKTKSTLQSITKNPQLNILKLSDNETAYLFSIIEKLQLDYLGSIGRLVSYHNAGTLKHITREKVIDGLWPDGFPEQIIRVKDSISNERIYVLEKSFYDLSKKDLSSVLELAKFSNEVSNKLKVQLEEKLTINKREAAFLKQEKQMVSRADKLRQLVDSLKNGLPKEIKNSLDGIKRFTNKTLSSYSKTEESLNKLKLGQELSSCFKGTTDLVLAVQSIPTQQQEIKKLYQDQVWNPFTATIMDEEVKKRITRAYEKYLIPYFLNEIKKNLSCENQSMFVEKMQYLNRRMLAMRNEDTRKLERKLKRIDDPIEILKLFGVSNEAFNEGDI